MRYFNFSAYWLSCQSTRFIGYQAWARRRLAAEGSVDAAIAQSNRDTEVGADRHGCSRRQLARFGKLHGSLDQLGAIDNALTVAVLQRIRTPNTDRDVGGQRVNAAKDASFILELRNERDFHTSERAHGMQRIEHHVVGMAMVWTHGNHFCQKDGRSSDAGVIESRIIRVFDTVSANVLRYKVEPVCACQREFERVPILL
ncbi:MAG: hypothetical protein KGL42_11910 [Betaproteobacteria bacterium]|nr:hypothetical protein [Betaproteobacteria bacterium]